MEDAGTTRVVQRRTRIHPTPSLSGFEDNIFISFLLSTLCLQPLRVGATALWLQVHAESIKSPAAQHSIVALSSLYFGRKHHREDILNRGIQSYGKALKSLNEELRDPEKCVSVSALSSASVLQVYEVRYFTLLSQLYILKYRNVVHRHRCRSSLADACRRHWKAGPIAWSSEKSNPSRATTI